MPAHSNADFTRAAPMSAHTATKRVRTLRVLAAFAALFAVSATLSANESAAASERVKDEVSRNPVQYQVGGNCANALCSRDLLTTPNGKRRIELSTITCTVMSVGGQILSVRLKEKDVAADFAHELLVNYNGANNGFTYYSATSTARFRLPKSTEYELIALSSTEVQYFRCAALGEQIKYSQ